MSGTSANNFSTSNLLPHGNILNNLLILTMIIFAMAGIEIIPTFANSVKNPRKNLFYGLSFIIYFVTSLKRREMAYIEVSDSVKRSLFNSDVDRKKAIFLTFVAFLFTGFQCAIYGMLTIPVSEHFDINSNTIIFFDGFGLWGQILAMATGGIIIRKIKGKNTLVLAALLMIVGSVFSIFATSIYIYTFMTFICNMAVGYVLVSCNYMVMGTVKKEGESEGKLSILNLFLA